MTTDNRTKRAPCTRRKPRPAPVKGALAVALAEAAGQAPEPVRSWLLALSCGEAAGESGGKDQRGRDRA